MLLCQNDVFCEILEVVPANGPPVLCPQTGGCRGNHYPGGTWSVSRGRVEVSRRQTACPCTVVLGVYCHGGSQRMCVHVQQVYHLYVHML